MARLTTAKFIEDAKVKHGERYDYSQVCYVTKKTPVTIICKVHGAFNATPELIESVIQQMTIC